MHVICSYATNILDITIVTKTYQTTNTKFRDTMKRLTRNSVTLILYSACIRFCLIPQLLEPLWVKNGLCRCACLVLCSSIFSLGFFPSPVRAFSFQNSCRLLYAHQSEIHVTEMLKDDSELRAVVNVKVMSISVYEVAISCRFLHFLDDVTKTYWWFVLGLALFLVRWLSFFLLSCFLFCFRSSVGVCSVGYSIHADSVSIRSCTIWMNSGLKLTILYAAIDLRIVFSYFWRLIRL